MLVLVRPKSPRATGQFAILPEKMIAIKLVDFFRCLLYLTSCIFSVLLSYLPGLPSHGILGGIPLRMLFITLVDFMNQSPMILKCNL